MISKELILQNIDNTLKVTNFDWLGKRYQGKVRDTYKADGKLVLITTDRQSAFDVVLAEIPGKGQVLNQISVFWFEATKDIVPNHILSVPDPNVMIAKDCTPFKIEMVVRAYITGVTSTSVWTAYNEGKREFCGNHLPDGLVKNQKIPHGPILTPSTKPDVGHDKSISSQEAIEMGLCTAAEWDTLAKYSLALFKRGTEVAAKNGLILVDTKYEFGRDAEGNIVVIDEVHTPDSSRFWIADSYDARMAAGEEPESLDKEFLRLWLKEHGFTDTNIPVIPDEMRAEFAIKYINLYERITGKAFEPHFEEPILERIEKNLRNIIQ